MYKIILNVLAMLAGVAFIGLAYFYWVTPAGELPAYVPGFVEGATNIHYKHAIASFLLGFAAFAFAWFASGSGKKHSNLPIDNLTEPEKLVL
jgi:hypothetical protein